MPLTQISQPADTSLPRTRTKDLDCTCTHSYPMCDYYHIVSMALDLIPFHTITWVRENGLQRNAGVLSYPVCWIPDKLTHVIVTSLKIAIWKLLNNLNYHNSTTLVNLLIYVIPHFKTCCHRSVIHRSMLHIQIN